MVTLKPAFASFQPAVRPATPPPTIAMLRPLPKFAGKFGMAARARFVPNAGRAAAPARAVMARRMERRDSLLKSAVIVGFLARVGCLSKRINFACSDHTPARFHGVKPD